MTRTEAIEAAKKLLGDDYNGVQVVDDYPAEGRPTTTLYVFRKGDFAIRCWGSSSWEETLLEVMHASGMTAEVAP